MAPRFGIAESRFNERQQAGQGADILIVVADDLDEPRRLAVAQELQVPGRDLPARHIAVTAHAEQFGLGGLQLRVGHPVPEHSPDDRQKIQVAGVGRRHVPGHPVAGDEERPVEALAVVGHQPA